MLKKKAIKTGIIIPLPTDINAPSKQIPINSMDLLTVSGSSFILVDFPVFSRFFKMNSFKLCFYPQRFIVFLIKPTLNSL